MCVDTHTHTLTLVTMQLLIGGKQITNAFKNQTWYDLERIDARPRAQCVHAGIGLIERID